MPDPIFVSVFFFLFLLSRNEFKFVCTSLWRIEIGFTSFARPNDASFGSQLPPLLSFLNAAFRHCRCLSPSLSIHGSVVVGFVSKQKSGEKKETQRLLTTCEAMLDSLTMTSGLEGGGGGGGDLLSFSKSFNTSLCCLPL